MEKIIIFPIIGLIFMFSGCITEQPAEPQPQKTAAVKTDCGAQTNNAYKNIEPAIQQVLKRNEIVADILNQGYSMKEVCKTEEKVLIMMDYEKGYIAATMKASITEDLNQISKKATIGLADETMQNIQLFEVEIPDYRFSGTGAVACHFNEYKDQKISYTCYNASDEKSIHRTYNLNTKTGENKLVDEKEMEYKF